MKLSFKGAVSRSIWLGIGGLIIVLAAAGFIVWHTHNSAAVRSATQAYQSGDLTKAMDLFAQARDKHLLTTAADWNIYGNVYRDAKHIPEASDAYMQAIKLDPGYEATYRNLAYLYVDWADQSKDPQKLTQAIGIIEKGRASHPKSITMVEDLIMLYGKVGNSAKVTELTALRTQLLK